MVFGRKKDMIELSEVQKRNVNLPHGRKFVPSDGLGFVDLTVKRKLPSEIAREKREKLTAPATVFQQPESSSSSAFSFFDTTPKVNATTSSDQEELLRKISMQISDFDTKMYKMEQRIDLLERKAGITNSDSSTPATGGFNW